MYSCHFLHSGPSVMTTEVLNFVCQLHPQQLYGRGSGLGCRGARGSSCLRGKPRVALFWATLAPAKWEPAAATTCRPGPGLVSSTGLALPESHQQVGCVRQATPHPARHHPLLLGGPVTRPETSISHVGCGAALWWACSTGWRGGCKQPPWKTLRHSPSQAARGRDPGDPGTHRAPGVVGGMRKGTWVLEAVCGAGPPSDEGTPMTLC